ncbi:TonB-dependent receptor plug domain-containing protein, partial [Planctomycetota bacterium]
MKRVLSLSIACVLTCSMAVVILGEDAPEKKLLDTVKLEDMVVTPSRREMLLSETPDFIVVISKEDIDELNPTSTGDIIEYATGVSVETGTGSGLPDRSIVSLNGLPANYTLVLVDGVRLITDHIHTGQNVDFIPPQSIERIEVMRGSASAQYGSDAIGGVVNIVTRKCGDTFSGSIGSTRTTVTEYTGYEGSLSLFTPAGERVRFSTFLNWEESDGAPIKKPNHRVGHMGYDRMNISTRMDAQLTESSSMYAYFNWVHNTIDWRGTWEESHLATPAVGLTCTVSPAVDVIANMVYSR